MNSVEATTTTRLNTALILANSGIKVYPLSQYSKIPVQGSHGEQDATTDKELIQNWFDDNPYYNLAINLKESGLVVLDLDNHTDETNGVKAFSSYLKRNNIDGGFLHTYAEHTPQGGGFHFFFNSKLSLPKETIELMPGVELLTGKAITAPSRIINHNKGVDGSYTPVWDNYPTLDKNGLQELPQWIVDLAQHKAKEHHTNNNYQPGVKRWSGRLLDELVHGVSEGGRNIYLTKLAGKMVRIGADSDTIYNLLTYANSNCEPPLPDHEVNSIFASILRKGGQQ